MRKSKDIDVTKLLNILPTTPISDLKVDDDFYKIIGRLEMNISMQSLLTKSKCIGYTFEEKKWVSRRPYKNNHSERKWKTVSSETECQDFYIEDKSGKIKVNAYGIKIYLITNENKKVKNGTYLFENLLLNDNTNYIVLGTVSKSENNDIELSKSLLGQKLIIMDEKYYNLYVKKNPFLRLGCAILLIGLAILFLFIFIKFFLKLQL